MLIKQDNTEDTRSILSAEKQTKKLFVASLVPVAFCQLLIRIRVGMGEAQNQPKVFDRASLQPQPSSGSTWNLPSRALHAIAPQRAMPEWEEKAQKGQVRGTQSSWSCFQEDRH